MQNKMKGKIFTAQKIQAIKSGNAVMFREVVRPLVSSDCKAINLEVCNTWQWAATLERRECPYQVGQKIFCKESFCGASSYKGITLEKELKIEYKADSGCLVGKWKPAKHMKQEHSRLTLEITGIRVERLADISEEDAIKEGFKYKWEEAIRRWSGYKKEFANHWNATHKKPEEKFDASPWVWVVSVEVVK